VDIRPSPKADVLVCLFFLCFVRLRISPARIKLAASNFARWFTGVLGRESPILGNFASPEAQNRTNPDWLKMADFNLRNRRRLEFRGDLWCQKTRAPVLSSVVVFMILYLTIWYSTGLADRQTDGRTDTRPRRILRWNSVAW